MNRATNLTRRAATVAALTALAAIQFGSERATAQSAIAFVQANSAVPQTAMTVVTVPYAAAQEAGDLNVVVVGWNDTTAKVLLVADTNGNPYTPAVAPTVMAGLGTQAIYYAKNIQAAAANANVVTVTFSQGAQYADIRIAEYSGIDKINALDASMGGQGTGSLSDSDEVTTTGANDLFINQISPPAVSSWTGGPVANLLICAQGQPGQRARHGESARRRLPR